VNGTLPTSLIDYRDALEDAVRRDLGRSGSRRRRGLVLRWALAAAVVVAAALGALSLISRDGAGASVVDRAAAAVAPSPGTILHVDMHGFQDNGDGSTITWRDESWQQQGPPHDGRQIETAPDGSVVETATANGREEVYDSARNTIYVSAPESTATPAELNSYDIEAGTEAGNGHPPRAGAASRGEGRPRRNGRHHHEAGEGAQGRHPGDRVQGQPEEQEDLPDGHPCLERAEAAALERRLLDGRPRLGGLP
jgi:hypothetical protein